jgi:bifunctional DNA-binding transcriptional regulator/antitoxin component of YhaV-PrlF toxin-antitoxin module
MCDTATLSDKFQISVPKAVQEAEGYKAGRRFAFVPKPSGMILMPIPSPDELAGTPNGSTPADFRDRDDRVLGC